VAKWDDVSRGHPVCRRTTRPILELLRSCLQKMEMWRTGFGTQASWSHLGALLMFLGRSALRRFLITNHLKCACSSLGDFPCGPLPCVLLLSSGQDTWAPGTWAWAVSGYTICIIINPTMPRVFTRGIYARRCLHAVRIARPASQFSCWAKRQKRDMETLNMLSFFFSFFWCRY